MHVIIKHVVRTDAATLDLSAHLHSCTSCINMCATALWTSCHISVLASLVTGLQGYTTATSLLPIQFVAAMRFCLWETMLSCPPAGSLQEASGDGCVIPSLQSPVCLGLGHHQG